jgi:hypothetical protein
MVSLLGNATGAEFLPRERQKYTPRAAGDKTDYNKIIPRATAKGERDSLPIEARRRDRSRS